MNNLPTVQLPAHLAMMQQNSALMSVNAGLSAGLSSGAWPRISIKSSRFRLQNATGEEVVVPNLYLDVIIVEGNPHGVSKTYYTTKWDPSQEGAAPDCWSDNGVGP